MAAPMLKFVKFYLRPTCAFKVPHTVYLKWPVLIASVNKLKAPLARCLLLSAAGVKVEASVESTSNSMPMTFEPNDPRLRSHECLKNAAGLAVDSTSAVLSQTVYALSNVEEQYIELVNVLIILMEYQLQILGHPEEEQRMADLILETRHEISEVYKRKQDLELLFSSVQKLADATAEVAFATGANYASTSACERLVSAEQELERVKRLSDGAEKRLREAEVKTIKVMTKHEEKTAKEKKEREAAMAQKLKEDAEKAEEEKVRTKSYVFSECVNNNNDDDDLNQNKSEK